MLLPYVADACGDAHVNVLGMLHARGQFVIIII